MTAALQLAGLSAGYGSLQALRDIDLEVGADELLVVLGPSGAGKTTLLRTVVGLHHPSAGRVQLDDVDITSWPPAERDMALVFQNFSLYPGWTVRRNLAFPLLAPGRPAVDVEARVKSVAELLRLEALLDRPAEHLSGGEMQRVAIGRAIVRRPRLFLLDEPLTNLDAKLREELRVELVVLRRELGIPMIYVTHDQAEALSMGDRVAVLVDGQIQQVGAPSDVYDNPVSPQVARLLGEPAINLIPVDYADAQWMVQGTSVPVCSATGSNHAPQWLGARPESVAPTGGDTAGSVLLVEDTGPHLVLVVEWAGQTLHLVQDGRHRWQVGDTVHPCFDTQRTRLWPRS